MYRLSVAGFIVSLLLIPFGIGIVVLDASQAIHGVFRGLLALTLVYNLILYRINKRRIQKQNGGDSNV